MRNSRNKKAAPIFETALILCIKIVSPDLHEPAIDPFCPVLRLPPDLVDTA